MLREHGPVCGRCGGAAFESGPARYSCSKAISIDYDAKQVSPVDRGDKFRNCPAGVLTTRTRPVFVRVAD